jgi:hypothetical protein
VIRFAWRPPGGAENEYDMRDPADQHQLLLLRGVAPEGGKYPVVIGLHGQPRRGQAPRSYAFAPAVILVSETAVSKGATPFVLALPVFRYRGTNWPAFDLAAFRIKLGALLEAEHIQATEYYVFGHSGAAGCGGDGMNRAHRISPAAVGFFDTCIGPGWAAEVRALRAAQIPTLVIHSVETAGFNPRPAQEYMANFDFGHAYAPAGLSPSPCPAPLPAAPLRPQRFGCAADPQGTTRALVIDTGDGESAHNAALPVALAYFIEEYVNQQHQKTPMLKWNAPRSSQ